MSKTYETGHAKNVANFQKLIEFVTDYGTIYNPAKTSLKLATLIALQTDAEEALEEVIAKNTLYNNAVNSRISEFSDLRTLSTRLVNALQSTDATPETPTDPDASAPQNISASQMSYDQLIQHFTGLKSVLEKEKSYAPNEIDLQINTLETKISNMTTKNTAVTKAYTKVSNTRIARDKILYDGEDAILETAGEVKKYVRFVFGGRQPTSQASNRFAFQKIENPLV